MFASNFKVFVRVSIKLWSNALLVSAICLALPLPGDDVQQNWTHFVRIGAYGLLPTNANAIIADARASNVFGIEADNDIPGRYESFLDPTEKLAAIRSVAQKAHEAGNRAFVYIAGTECITANADKAAHSVVKDHPDWLQRKITGEPAVFTGGAAFWIREGDETSGSALMRLRGVMSIWKESARLLRPASMAFISIFLIG